MEYNREESDQTSDILERNSPEVKSMLFNQSTNEFSLSEAYWK